MDAAPDSPQATPNEDDQGRTLFAYEASTDGRLVTRLVGIGSGRCDVRVVAEIYPVHTPETAEPQWRFYDFPNHDRAHRFADETLLALEYLGCTVTEPVQSSTDVTMPLVAGAVAA